MVVTFVLIGWTLALPAMSFRHLQPVFSQVTTGAVDRAPFWLLLSAVRRALLFNRKAAAVAKRALTCDPCAVASTGVFSLEQGAFLHGERRGGRPHRCLVWLRFRRPRTPMVAIILALACLVCSSGPVGLCRRG